MPPQRTPKFRGGGQRRFPSLPYRRHPCRQKVAFPKWQPRKVWKPAIQQVRRPALRVADSRAPLTRPATPAPAPLPDCRFQISDFPSVRSGSHRSPPQPHQPVHGHSYPVYTRCTWDAHRLYTSLRPVLPPCVWCAPRVHGHWDRRRMLAGGGSCGGCGGGRGGWKCLVLSYLWRAPFLGGGGVRVF